MKHFCIDFKKKNGDRIWSATTALLQPIHPAEFVKANPSPERPINKL